MPSMARIDPFASPSRNASLKMQSLFHDSSPDFGPVKYEVNQVRRQPALPQTSFDHSDTVLSAG